jgi:hypothetical protein
METLSDLSSETVYEKFPPPYQIILDKVRKAFPTEDFVMLDDCGYYLLYGGPMSSVMLEKIDKIIRKLKTDYCIEGGSFDGESFLKFYLEEIY